MDLNDINEKVFEVLADKASMDPKYINAESSLVKDLGLDSLDAIEMVFEFEEHYGIQIPDDQIREFKTAGDIVEYLLMRFEKNL